MTTEVKRNKWVYIQRVLLDFTNYIGYEESKEKGRIVDFGVVGSGAFIETGKAELVTSVGG